MTEITPGILLGGYREAGREGDIVSWYHRLKVDHVLCVASELAPPAAAGIVVKHLPLDDDNPGEDISKILDPATAFVAEATSKRGTVLIHCRDGASRAVCVTVAVLVACYGYSLVNAYHYVSHRRKQTNVFPHYLDQLQKWAQQREATSNTSHA